MPCPGGLRRERNVPIGIGERLQAGEVRSEREVAVADAEDGERLDVADNRRMAIDERAAIDSWRSGRNASGKKRGRQHTAEGSGGGDPGGASEKRAAVHRGAESPPLSMDSCSGLVIRPT